MVAGMFSALQPHSKVSFLNRGVGGNRVIDLKNRWSADCIDLKPNVVSIMIGINDTWRRYDSNNPTSVEAYEESFREILSRTRQELDAKIVIVEPFVLPYPADRAKWREDLDPKIQVARSLAGEFADVFVPMDGIFAQHAVLQGMEIWAGDGVHPTPAGHGLIAKAWLDAVC